VQQAFEMIGWDDGSELLGVSAEAPSAVQNLEVSPTGVGELTVTWEAPATGDATSYTITLTTTVGTGSTSSSVYSTTNTSYKVSGLSPANGYKFSVTASNADGTSSAAEDSFGQAAIDVGVNPQALTTGHDGSIWVANEGSSQPVAPPLAAPSPVETQFGSLSLAAPSPVENTSSTGGNTVQQIVNVNGDWTAQAAIGVGSEPSGLTTGHDGSIWVANSDSNTVQQIVNDNGVWTAQAAIDVGTSPGALTTGLDGSIWVANYSSNTVQQIVNDNGVWTAQAAIGVGTYPEALTTGHDGSIWVANESSNTVQQIVNANGVWTAQAAIGVYSGPFSLTTGLDGSIWAANQTSGTVQQILKNDNGVWTAQTLVVNVGTKPYSLTTGLDGSIWVANYNSNTVQRIVNANGVWTAQAAIYAGFGPSALTTGHDGSIWVANYRSNTVQQIAVQPNAPSDLAAVFGPGPGEMTLAWQPPVIDGGTPVISYTATVAQGTYTKTITTSDTSCVFDGLTLGSGPTYFTVTANNFAGESKTAALQIDASGNTIPKQLHTGIGITTDGVAVTDGGFDGSGNTYSWTALGDTSSGGALVGSSLISGGLAFDIGIPNQPDFTIAAGQDIEATGSGTVLTLAAAAVTAQADPLLTPVSGSQVSQTLTLNFDDDTTATWTQSFSNWLAPQYFDNESILSTQSYGNTASGGTNDTTNYIYSYGYTLPEGKTLESITLPNNSNLRILGATLSDPTVVDLSENWNAYGLVVANNEVPNGLGFDGHGNYYNANYGGFALGLQTASNSDQDTDNFDYRTITWGGATFNLGPAPNRYTQSNDHTGNDNFMRFAGQTIDLQSGDFSKLLMIGAGANGNQTDQAIYLNFSDGYSLRWTQSFTDWANDNGDNNNSPPSGSTLASTNEALAATTSWVNHYGKDKVGYNRFVYGYSYDIPAGKTLESITLPNNSDVGILGMALIPAPSVPTSASQNLTATPVSINGLDIAWSRPEEVSGGSGTQITYEVTVVQGTLSYTEDTTATALSLPQGLVLGTSYTVTVLPKTQYGDGTPATLTQVYPV
jgi:streptogramin lyase